MQPLVQYHLNPSHLFALGGAVANLWSNDPFYYYF